MIKMSDLKREFENLGFKNVQTYINSGNVIFTDDSKESRKIEKDVEKVLDSMLSKQIRVLVRGFDEIKELDEEISKNWKATEERKVDVMFLSPEIDNRKIIHDLQLDESVEDFKYFPGVLLWAVSKKNFGRSKMAQVVGTKIYREMSVRNPNTVHKIFELMNALAESN